MGPRRISYVFAGEEHGFSTPAVLGVSLVVGLVGGMYGIGGGAIIALLDRSAPIAPDSTLGLLFGLGGMVGMSLGACCQRRVPARLLEWMPGLILVSVAARYVVGFFV